MKFYSRLLFLVSFSFISVIEIIAQNTNFANSWIDPVKTYYKLKVTKNGIYKVNFDDLVKIGFPSNTKGADLKLINIGKEKPIFVSNSTSFGPGDYIEFIGEKHTIGVDSTLYGNWKEELFNPRFSITSDTNVYFLTISEGTNNLRMTTVSPDYVTNALTPSTFCLFDETIVYSNFHYKIKEFETQQSFYESSQGYGDNITANSTHKFFARGFRPSSIKPLLRFRYGQGSYGSELQVNWNDRFLDVVKTPSKINVQKSYTLSDSDISSNNSLNLKNILSDNDRHRVAFATLTYPRDFDFSDEKNISFTLTAATAKRYIRFKKSSNVDFAYDLNRNIRYATIDKDGFSHLIVNGATTALEYFIPEKIETIENISVYNPITFPDTDADYIIISNPKLQGPDLAVDQYAQYRSTPEGGSYKTRVININDLYDAFSYGISYHPMSVKNFASYIDERWSNVKMVFVLGKALEYNYMRNQGEAVNNAGVNFFVPTFGVPGSDVLLFADKNKHYSRFGIGRLAAKTPNDILDYLDKIKTYDAAPNLPQTSADKLWIKKALHLGGGKNAGEQSAIRSGLEGFEKILTDTVFGGIVSAYYKNTNDAVQFSVNQEINDRLNNGVSILNFFGHSAASTWDFSIQNPRDFKNKDKYPFITSFGCYSGNLHSPTSGISESFVLQGKKASIGFYASTGTAFINSLSDYGRKFYLKALQSKKHLTVGEVIRELGSEATAPIDNTTEYALFTQLTYHGDPAVKFYVDEEPDFTFDLKSVKFQQNLQTSDDSIYIELSVANIGAHKGDSIDLVFYHLLPNGKYNDTLLMRVLSLGAITPVTLKFRNPGFDGTGRNVLYGAIDVNNKINEEPKPEAENNNTLVSDNGVEGFEFFIRGNVANPIYPPNFGIINTPDHFVLKASTALAPINKTNYIVQIDTTRYFNSPVFETVKIESYGGLIEFKPTKGLKENVVYYWRISPDSTSVTESYKWRQSSFIFLPQEEEGWNQSHFFQFTDDSFTDMSISENTKRRFQYDIEKFNVKMRNKLQDSTDPPVYVRNNIIIGSVRRVWDYLDGGLVFMVMDYKIGGQVRNSPSGLYGSLPPGGEGADSYAFSTKTPEDRKKIMDFISTIFTSGRYLAVMSVIKNISTDMKIQDWDGDKALYGTTLFEVFENMGAVNFSLFKSNGSVPYILNIEKNIYGEINVIQEIMATVKDQIIETNNGVDSKLKRVGNVTSTIIGPATLWNELKFSIDEKTGLNEKAWVDLYGIQNDGKEIKIDSNLVQSRSIKDINADTYKYLKLKNTNFDTTDITSAQLNFWRISNKTLPDAAVFLDKESNELKIQQGDKISIPFKIKNVGTEDMDSILVKYTIFDDQNKETSWFKRLAKLPASAILTSNLDWTSSLGIKGGIRAIVEINPNEDQPELYTFNNRLIFTIGVKPDDLNPNLLVYFDGIQILDGDIVSSTPEIKITLKDDNPLLPITDPNSFEINLDTSFNKLINIPVNSPSIKFTPATSSNGEASILYTPQLKDGSYTLIVQGKDASGNKSGQNAKAVNFRVINEETVTQVLNYPNPFSTSTQFIFTLTGNDIPESMTITIMTVSGKVVREITRDQLGPLRIGINRTEYKWDGTDEYGSKLANGVYLYKVNIRNRNGDKYKINSEGKLSSMFEKGIGKLVIMR